MNALYDMINILPLSLLMIMLFGSYADIPQNGITYLICTVSTVFMTALRHMGTKNRLRSTGIVSVFLIGLCIAADEEYKQIFIDEHFWIVWVVCFSAAAFAAGMILDRNIWARRAAAVAMLCFCLCSPIFGTAMSKQVFALISFLLLMRAAEEIQLRWKKSGCPDMKEHITRISPFFLAICLAVYLLPAPVEAFSWQFAKNLYYNAVSVINRVYGSITHISDDYGKMGFSENTRFLSGLSSNDDAVLNIEADRANLKDLRLTGCMSNEFIGREWVFDPAGNDFSRMMDTMETSAAVSKYTSSYRSDYLQTVNLRFENLYYNTQYIFSPAKIRFETTKRKNRDIYDRNGTILSDRKLYFQDDYTVTCYLLNYGNPHLEEFLSSAAPLDEEDWKDAVSGEGAVGKAGYSYEDYLRYRNSIRSKSCGVSKEVRSILDRIGSGSPDRYETAKRLEAYLRSMEYSTDCGSLPDDISDGGDFLDYFLLTSRNGYCMHYATAFVLMANEMGLPCRYVQGYNVTKDADGRFIARQSGAHAWPEVYFDNVGWVAFEPTPGFSVSAGWMIKEDYEIQTDEDKYTDYYEMYKKENEVLPEAELPEEEPERIDSLILIIPTAAVLTFLLLFYILSHSLSAGRYKRMSPHDKFTHLTHQCLRFLGLLDLMMEKNETLSEYSDRIRKQGPAEVNAELGFIPVYEAVLYSDREITEEDVKTAEKANRTLRGLAKKGRLRSRLLIMLTASYVPRA